jgi:hypothetical protein
MSQGQETQPSHLPLEGPGASPEAGSDERQKANILLHKLIEQGLRDMAKSAQTVRDVMISAQPSEEASREQALIEHEERIAAIQALAQGVSDLQSLMNMPGHRSDIPTSGTHSLSRDEVKQTRREQGGIDIASGVIEPKEEEQGHIACLKLGGENSKPSLPTPHPNTSPAEVPLHLIPLVPPRSSPSNRRRASIDPLFVATKNDEDAIDLPWRINLLNATGETTSDSPSDLWHFQNCEAGSPGISRTLAYAMGCTPVGSSHLPIPGGVGVYREANDAEQAHRPPVITARSGIMEEGPRPEAKSPHRVSSSDVEAGRVREIVEEMKTVAKDIPKDQGQEGAEIDHTEVCGEPRPAKDETDDLTITRQRRTLAQPHPEGRYIELMEREMEIHRAKLEVKILEETLQAREKDLCDRLETVRQRLQVIRQRKALMDHQEDIRQQSRAGEHVVEAVEPRLAAVQEVQRAGVEADALWEETS